jgi:hypothetical protein
MIHFVNDNKEHKYNTLKIVMTILLNCCYLNINPVVEGLQENDCYISAGPPFRPKDTGAANYEVVERKDQSNANAVKQNSQETALYSIVDKKSSGKYTNSNFIFFLACKKCYC